MSDMLTIAGRQFHSRLFVGTGKYRSHQEMARCHAASGSEVVTLAVRRVNLTDRSKESMLDFIDRSKLFILPNTANLRIMREMITEVPMIVDAGVGTASDAAIAMELGADGVLMNTAIAAAEDSVRMAEAMKLAVEAGRLAYLAGRMPKKLYASASSPMTGVVGR